jgi:hypothetical protein
VDEKRAIRTSAVRDGSFQLVWKLWGCNPLPSRWVLLVYMDLLPRGLSHSLAMELTMKSSKSRGYVYIGSPGKLANSWQMAF